MTKEELKDYLLKALTNRSRTSYKFYFLLALLDLSRKKDTLLLKECGKCMIVLSWNDLSNPKNNYPKVDKLKRYKIELMKKYNLSEYITEKEKKRIIEIEDKQISKIAYELTYYCPYLFLSIGQWDKRLVGIINYHDRHKLIQEFSQQESCLYEIYDNKIVLNSEFFDIIRTNKEDFYNLVRKELNDFLQK